ncbi:MAG: hypothetical protein WCS65_04255 [Verrucomicrobiae bacterium]
MKQLLLQILSCSLAVLAANVLARAQAPAAKSERSSEATVKILNVCDTAQLERWRTGLDLKFMGRAIGKDIRLGESGPAGKISFAGKDSLEVFRHGPDAPPLARVPANFKPGGKYAFVIMGQLDAGSAALEVRAIEEFPIPPESLRPGRCRVQILNAVQKFPVTLEILQQKSAPMAFGEIRELFFLPGKLDLALLFPDARGETARIPASLLAKAGDSYTLVIHPSAERPDRPDLARSHSAERPAESD